MRRRHLPRWLIGLGLGTLGAAVVIGLASASTRAPRLPIAQLVALAAGSARGLHDRSVTSALVVATTKNAAENWLEPGAVPPGPTDPRVYVVVLSGKFVCTLCSAPAGAQLPHGHSAQFIWQPGRGVTDFGLTAHAPWGIDRLGRVVTIALHPRHVS
jgi:hypothetical protein